MPIRIGIVLERGALPVGVAVLVASLKRGLGASECTLLLNGRRRPPLQRLGDLVARTWLAAERGILALAASGVPGLGSLAGDRLPPHLPASDLFESTVDLADPQGAAAPFDLLLTFGSAPPPADWLRFREEIRIEPGAGEESLLRIGFREVFRGDSRTAIRLSRVTPEGCGGSETLVSGHTRTKPLFYLNQAALGDRAASLLLTYLASGGFCPGSDAPRALPVDNRPSEPALDGRLLVYPFRTAGRLLRFAGRHLAGKRRWSVAIHALHPGDGSLGAPLPVEPAPQGTYHADPFLYHCRRSDRMFCFVEEYDEASSRAHIAVLERAGQEWQRRGVALREPYHLSFPFVFHYADDLYMCPEGSAGGRIIVYRCCGLPLQWEPAAVLMADVSAADTMLFERGGRWWMLTNLDRAATPDHQSELHVFHADSPLSNRWIPLPCNPVKLDPNGARNGGLVRQDGRLFRMGQKHGFMTYGQGLDMFEIVRLDPQGYEERHVRSFEVPASLAAQGTHTYVTANGLAAFDLLGAAQAPAPSSASGH